MTRRRAADAWTNESRTDGILETQPRTAPGEAAALGQSLAAPPPERLQINDRLQEALARALAALERPGPRPPRCAEG